MKYRSSVSIYAEMLEIARTGALKTRIMYGTNQPTGYFKQALELLIERRLVSYERESRLYTTTSKGLQFLKAYDEMMHLLPTLLIQTRR